MADRKSTLEDYLVSRHGFTSIHLESANHYVRTRKFTLIFVFPPPLLRPPCARGSVVPGVFRPLGPLSDVEQGKFPIPHTSTLSPIWKTERGDRGNLTLILSVRFRCNQEMTVDRGPDLTRHGKRTPVILRSTFRMEEKNRSKRRDCAAFHVSHKPNTAAREIPIRSSRSIHQSPPIRATEWAEKPPPCKNANLRREYGAGTLKRCWTTLRKIGGTIM